MVKCDKNEVLRYLGYKNQKISDELSALIDEIMSETENKASLRYCTFESSSVSSKDGIYLNDCDLLLTGKDIEHHLKDCNRVILFSATLGVEIDRYIHLYETRNLTRAIIMDCCASSLIECYCNYLCIGFKEKFALQNLFLTSRYSPGYGDLPLSLQPKLLRILNSQRQIGLTCNEQFLMFPRKSVTAIIGISENPIQNCTQTSCDICSMNSTCQFRRSDKN